VWPALLLAAVGHCWAAQEIVTVPTRTGVTESYLLIRNPPSAVPKVVVIALVGGYGAIGLAKSFPLISVSGGDPPQSGPCDSQAVHGFFGKVAAVAKATKDWMFGRDFPREIN